MLSDDSMPLFCEFIMYTILCLCSEAKALVPGASNSWVSDRVID